VRGVKGLFADSPAAGGTRRAWPLALSLAAALAAGVPARDEGQRGPVFEARAADGKAVRGPLRRLGPGWSVRLGAEGGTVEGAGLLTLRRTDLPRPAFPTGPHFILANGDRVPAKGVRLDGERLYFRHPDLAGGQETSLPLGALAVWWVTPPDRAADPEKLRRRLAAQRRTRDVILLRNGDTVEGVLSALDAAEAGVEVDKKKVSVKVSQVAAVALSTELADALRPKGAYARLVLAGNGTAHGTRLSLTSAECADGATLTGTTAFGAQVRVPVERVAALDVFQGAAVYLSDLKPAKYESSPFTDAAWPFAADANVAGHDLRLGGSVYDKGLGLHNRGGLTYKLDGRYRRFEALVGLDERDGDGGSARVKVLADGKPLDIGARRALTAKAGPLPVSAPVAGVKELTLLVEFGDNGDVLGVVDWADARLVR
jgi:hypothetical protein